LRRRRCRQGHSCSHLRAIRGRGGRPFTGSWGSQNNRQDSCSTGCKGLKGKERRYASRTRSCSLSCQGIPHSVRGVFVCLGLLSVFTVHILGQGVPVRLPSAFGSAASLISCQVTKYAEGLYQCTGGSKRDLPRTKDASAANEVQFNSRTRGLGALHKWPRPIVAALSQKKTGVLELVKWQPHTWGCI
jgi:hypothetical protein